MQPQTAAATTPPADAQPASTSHARATPPTAAEPTATAPTAVKPAAVKPTAVEPAAVEPAAAEPTAAEPAAEGLRLSVSALARRLGVAPATLRTWDRRYGVGPSDHHPGSHRRYTPQDVHRLELMQNALVHGASPAEAAQHALTTPTHTAAPTTATATTTTATTTTTAAAAATNQTASTASTTRTGYRSPLPMRGAGRPAHGLARAVLALDSDTTTRLLRNSINETGVITTWDDVARPVLRALAQRWARNGTGIELEHLLTEALTSVMAGITMTTPPPATTRPVLLATMTGELHALPLRVLAATLAERGVGTNLLGADLPLTALTAAITRTAPAAIFLWSHTHNPDGPTTVTQLPRTRPRTRCYVGGPGWNPTQLPPTIVILNTLHEATNVLTAAAGH